MNDQQNTTRHPEMKFSIRMTTLFLFITITTLVSPMKMVSGNGHQHDHHHHHHSNNHAENRKDPCSTGWIEFESKCYYFEKEKLFDFDQSQHFCKYHHSALVSIHSAPQNQFIAKNVA